MKHPPPHSMRSPCHPGIPLTWNSLSMASLGSSLMRGLLVMFLALSTRLPGAQER